MFYRNCADRFKPEPECVMFADSRVYFQTFVAKLFASWVLNVWCSRRLDNCLQHSTQMCQ